MEEVEELIKFLKLTDKDIEEIKKLTKPKSNYELYCELEKIAIERGNYEII